MSMQDPQCENETAAYRLFHHTFKLAIPQYYLYDSKHAEIAGVLGSNWHGDTDLDAQDDLNTKSIKHLSMAELCQLYQEHYHDIKNIEFIQGERAVIAYDIVKQHLLDWREYLSQPIVNPLPVPFKDLKSLDIMAGWLYHRAYYWLARDVVQNRLDNIDPILLQYANRFLGGVGQSTLSEEAKSKGHLANIEPHHTPIFDDLQVDDDLGIGDMDDFFEDGTPQVTTFNF